VSHLTTILVVIAICQVQIFVWWFIDRILRDRVDAIVSGVVRGVAVPKEHRRLSLWFSYLIHIAGAVGGQLGAGIAWLAAADAAGEEVLRLLCYLAAWITLMGVVAWTVNGIYWHRHLASVLRQAEAD